MLSGNIAVNGVTIGEWTATRTNSDLRQFANYDCTIWYRDDGGYRCEAQWQIWGEHESNGAVSLAARVLQEGKRLAKRVVVSAD